MAASWFLKSKGNEAGPFTTKQIKLMAKTGSLGKSDLVRNDQMESYICAKDIEGLFDETLRNSKVKKETIKNQEDTESKSWAFRNWTGKFKTFVGLSSLVGIVLILGLISAMRELGKDISLGDSKWSAKEYEKAADVYKKLIDNDIELIPEDKLVIIFDRVIQFSAANNDRKSLEKYATIAVERGLISKTINDYRVKLFSARGMDYLNSELKKGFEQIKNDAMPFASDPEALKNIGTPNFIPVEDPFKTK